MRRPGQGRSTRPARVFARAGVLVAAMLAVAAFGPAVARAAMPAAFMPQTAYIHPRITGDKIRYFEWMGAAVFTADQRAGAMHGKQFLLDSVHAGIDNTFVYGRLDFAGDVPEIEFELVVNLESWASAEARLRRALRLSAKIKERALVTWKVDGRIEEAATSTQKAGETSKIALLRNFEFRLPLTWLLAMPAQGNENVAGAGHTSMWGVAAGGKLRLRFSLWHAGLPVDALPMEGWIELLLVSEGDLRSGG